MRRRDDDDEALQPSIFDAPAPDPGARILVDLNHSTPERRRRQREIQEQFERFNRDHPVVFDELVRVARDWRSRGSGHWSIDAAYHVVRFQRRMDGLPDAGEAFKLNNNYTAHYSRLIMARCPDLEGLFETRER